MKKMMELNELLNSVKTQSPSAKNAQQLVNNRIMRGKQSNKKSFKNQEQEFITKTELINSKKIIRQSKIKQIDSQLLTLLKQMYSQKCKNLEIQINQLKFDEFLQKYVDKNASNPTNIKDLRDLNLVQCEEQINKLIIFDRVTNINISKSMIKPSSLHLQGIERLYLNNCKLGNAELQNLFDRLMQSNKIMVLSLSSPEVNNKNHLTKYDKLYELMQKSVTLKELYLSNCSIDRNSKIFEHLRQSSIKVLDLSWNDKVIGMSPVLEVLNLQGNQLTKPDALFNNDFKHSTQLKFLNISHNQIKQYDLKIFLRQGYLNKLEQLQMNNIKISDECECLQEFISYSNCLEKLSMVDCQLSTESWINFILGMKMNSSLREVNLTKNLLDSADVARAFGEILGGSRLRRLNLSQCSIKDELGSLIFSNLTKNKHLEHLNISKNKLSNLTGMTLSSSLKTNKVLKSLNIQNNCISYMITKELMGYTSRNSFLVAKLLAKEHSELIELNDLEKSLNQELTVLESSLLEMQHDHSSKEQKLHQMKAKHLNQKIEHSKKLILESLNEESQLLKKIQHIQAQINDQTMSDSSKVFM